VIDILDMNKKNKYIIRDKLSFIGSP